MDEYAVARFWADGRVSEIWGGTNEIMKDLIGRSMGPTPTYVTGAWLPGNGGIGLSNLTMGRED